MPRSSALASCSEEVPLGGFPFPLSLMLGEGTRALSKRAPMPDIERAGKRAPRAQGGRGEGIRLVCTPLCALSAFPPLHALPYWI